MAATDRLDQLWDIEALKKEQQEAVALVNEWLKNVADASKNFRISSQGLQGDNTLASLAENSKKAADATVKHGQATGELILSMKQYKAITDQIAVSEAKINALGSEQAKVLAVRKVQQVEVNNNLKIEAQLQNAASGSIEQARAVVKNLTAERNKLNLSTEEGKIRQKELNDEIDRQNQFIKDNVDAYTKQKINVGNYSGALTTLEGELANIRQKMDEYSKSGNQNATVLANMAREEQLLTKLVNSQVNGFASATMELRNNEKALQALGAAGLESTAFYKKLLLQTAELKDHVSDLKAEVKNLSSDTRTLDGLVAGAQLLAGSYGIAAASAELFGMSQDDVQEAQKKLQSILVILNGLQAIQNALQKESGFMLLAQSTATKIAAAAQWLYNLAIDAGSTSLRIFRGALIATGLGAIVVLLGEAASAMEKFATKTSDETKELERQNKQLQITKQFYDDLAQGYKEQSDVIIAQMEAEGATADQLRKQKELDAQAEVDTRKKAYDAAVANFNRYSAIELKVRNKSKSLTEAEAKAYNDALKDKDDASKAFHSAEDQRQILLSHNEKERKDETLKKTIELQDAQKGGLNETRRALQLAEASGASEVKIASLKKRLNQQELADLRTTLEANKNNADKKFEIEQQIADKIGERKAIEVDAEKKIMQQKLDNNKEFIALKRKELDYAAEAANDIATSEIANNSEIVNDQEASYSSRVSALDKFTKDSEALIDSDAQYQKQKAKEDADEAAKQEKVKQKDKAVASANIKQIYLNLAAQEKLIDEKSATSKLTLGRLTQKQYYSIVKASIDRNIQDQIDSLNLQEQLELGALNKHLEHGEEYEKKYNQIVAKYAAQRNEQSADYLQQQIETLKNQGADVTNLERSLGAIRLEDAKKFADASLQVEKEKTEKKKQLQSDILDATTKVIDLIAQKQQKAFDERAKQIDAEKDLYEKKIDHDYNIQKSAIDNQVLSEKDRAEKLAAIEQDKQDRIFAAERATAAQKAELDKRKEASDRRRFQLEQAVALAKVYVDMSEAIAKVNLEAATLLANPVTAALAPQALAQIPYIYASSAIAAGLIVAQTIAYAEGTPAGGHPGGAALIGERYEPEMVKEPGKQPYWITEPTYKEYLPKGTHVTPLHDIVAAGNGMISPGLINTLLLQGGSMNTSGMESKLDKIHRSIENMPVPSLNIDRGSIRKSVKRGNTTQHYIQRNIID